MSLNYTYFTHKTGYVARLQTPQRNSAHRPGKLLNHNTTESLRRHHTVSEFAAIYLMTTNKCIKRETTMLLN